MAPAAVNSDYNLRRAGAAAQAGPGASGSRRSRRGQSSSASSSTNPPPTTTTTGKRKSAACETLPENSRGKKSRRKQTHDDDVEEELGKGKAKASSKTGGDDDGKNKKQKDIREYVFLEEEVNCPINQEPFEDPVVASDGHTYERKSITDWFATCRRGKKPLTSPMTGDRMKSDSLRPNNLVRTITSQLKDKGLI